MNHLKSVEKVKNVKKVGKFVPTAVSKRVGRQILRGQKHSPTILFGVGVVGIIATTVTACRATLKLEEVLETTNEGLETARSLRDGNRMDYILLIVLLGVVHAIAIAKRTSRLEAFVRRLENLLEL